MKLLKELKWDALLKGILYILLGMVALFVPEAMERTLGYLIAVVLIIAGAVSMISYMLRDAYQNYYHNDFLHGLLGIALGIMVLYKVEIIISIIPFLLGVLVVVSGCAKLQDVIDMKRMENGNWIAMLALALVNLLFGILLVCNPFKAATMLFRLIGAGLLFSGITDCVTMLYFAKKIREYIQAKEAVNSTFEEVTKKTAAEGTEAAKEAETVGEAGTVKEAEATKEE